MITDLPADQIDIWQLPISSWSYQDLQLHKIEQLLSDKEFERFQRFRPLSKKNEFVASRILLRKLLTTYTDCSIKLTEARPDEMGRPFWFENDEPLELYFSLSHTKEMICCAVSKNREIGCDVESLQRRKYEVDLTERVFSEEERQHYRNLADERRSEFFYRSWTLKEAFIKAVGQGLRVPLTSLSFTHLAPDHDLFTVPSKLLGDSWASAPYTFRSTLSGGHSLGLATPITAPKIKVIHARIEEEELLV